MNVQFNHDYFYQAICQPNCDNIDDLDLNLLEDSVDKLNYFSKNFIVFKINKEISGIEEIIGKACKHLDLLKTGKVKVMTYLEMEKLSESQIQSIKKIVFVEKVLIDLSFIKKQIELNNFKIEWKNNQASKNEKQNHSILVKLIMNQKFSDEDVYNFLSDNKVRPHGGWFFKENQSTDLAEEFKAYRKMNVEDFFSKFSILSVAKPILHGAHTGQLTRSNLSEHVQRVIDQYYSHPFPDQSQIFVDIGGIRKKWISLSNEEKYQALWEHSLPHNQPKLKKLVDYGNNHAAWGKHLDDRLFRQSHDADGTPVIYLPHDPRYNHGSDHGVRVALFSAVFAKLYDKYHPNVTLKPEDYLIIQMAGAFHDSGRQTEGVDIDDKRSAENAKKDLTAWGISAEYVEKSAKAIEGKDDSNFLIKDVMAKSLQCADSAEYVRLLGCQNQSQFEESGKFLDITKEFRTLPSLKGGQSFEGFKSDLDAIRSEMNRLIFLTQNQREELSQPNRNYYDGILQQITATHYPKLHALLKEANVLSSEQPSEILIETGKLFPTMLDEIHLVNAAIGGTTGAQLFADSKGDQYVKKMPGQKITAEHLRVEYHTNKAYKALGIDVPEVSLYHSVTGQQIRIGEEQTTGDHPVMLSKFVPGKTQKLETFFGEALRVNVSQNGAEIEGAWKAANAEALREVQGLVQQGFVADCLLANWDVAGLTFDNLLIDWTSKKIWRIDNGAGLDYRAQGQKKDPKSFNEKIQEFQSFRNPLLNPNTTLLYERLTDGDIINQIDLLLPKKEAFLATIPDRLKEIMAQRFNYLAIYRDEWVAQSKQEVLQSTIAAPRIPSSETARSLSTSQAEWLENAKKNDSLANQNLLKKMIIDTNLSDVDFYHFLVSVSVKPDRGWFKYKDQATALAIDFQKFRKITVTEFFNKFK